MKAKAILSLVVMAVLVLSIGTACNKASTRSDAQVASDVQSKIFTDPNVQSRQISVQSANGIVTLSGYVNSEAERAAAANAAAGVDGVKTVVNNLQTQQAQAQPAEPQPTEEAKATETRPATKPAAREHRASAQRSSSNGGGGSSSSSNSGNNSNSGSTILSSNAAPATPPPPPAPKKVEVPTGTNLSIRLIDSLDSERNQVGDQFRATLNTPIMIGDEVVIPQDADIQGRVVDVKSAGRYAGASNLTLELTSLSFNGKTYNLSTNQWNRAAQGRGKSTAGKIGGGAALGAIIGGLAGGGKGAAIGATVGAGAGTGVASVGKGNQIKLNSEALLSFNLQAPLTVTASPTAGHNRQPMNQ